MDSDIKQTINRIMDEMAQLVKANTRQAVAQLESKIQEDIKKAGDRLCAELSAITKQK